MLPTQEQLTDSLRHHRHLRDIGNILLLFGVFVETIIDNIWEPLPPPLFSWPKSTRFFTQRNIWLKRAVMLLVGVVFVGGGITLEWIEGNRADDVADEQILSLAPRFWSLDGPAMTAALSSWPGQKIEIMRAGAGAPNLAFEYVYEEEDKLGGHLWFIFKDADWVGPDGTWLSMFMNERQRGSVFQGVAIEIRADAPPRTKEAAIMLRNQLKAAGLLIFEPSLRPLPIVPWPSGDDASTIVLTIGNRP